jgi:hypothetical protein
VAGGVKDGPSLRPARSLRRDLDGFAALQPARFHQLSQGEKSLESLS